MTEIQKIFVKPTKPEVKVRSLRGGHINEHGQFVRSDTYYLRRIKDGDLQQLTNEKEIKQAEAAAKKAAEAEAKLAQTQTTEEDA